MYWTKTNHATANDQIPAMTTDMTCTAPNKEMFEAVLATIKRTRAHWKGDPAYLEFLDTEIFALDLALLACAVFERRTFQRWLEQAAT